MKPVQKKTIFNLQTQLFAQFICNISKIQTLQQNKLSSASEIDPLGCLFHIRHPVHPTDSCQDLQVQSQRRFRDRVLESATAFAELAQILLCDLQITTKTMSLIKRGGNYSKSSLKLPINIRFAGELISCGL
jgi:hypothetical protein